MSVGIHDSFLATQTKIPLLVHEFHLFRTSLVAKRAVDFQYTSLRDITAAVFSREHLKPAKHGYTQFHIHVGCVHKLLSSISNAHIAHSCFTIFGNVFSRLFSIACIQQAQKRSFDVKVEFIS